MTKRGKLLISTAGAAALVATVFGLRGEALIGTGQEAQAVAASPVAEPKTIALAPAARDKNPVKVAAAEVMQLAGDIQVVGTVSFPRGPLRDGRSPGGGPDLEARRRGRGPSTAWSGDRGNRKQRGGTGAGRLGGARARYVAAEANLRRENDLAEKKISSSRERELAQAQWATEQAGIRAAVIRLQAIGLAPADIENLEKRDAAGHVPIRAPIAGTIIERHVTLGQAVERATDAFKIADLSHVWVTLDLYEKDLFRVHVGQDVELRTDARPGEILHGRVAFIVPVIDEATRTAKVRLEFPNPKGVVQVGQLVTARILAGGKRDAVGVLAVPRSAVEQLEGKTIVFVKTGEGFERRSVLLGSSGGTGWRSAPASLPEIWWRWKGPSS